MLTVRSRRRPWRAVAGALALVALVAGVSEAPARAAGPAASVDLFVGTQDNAATGTTASAYGDTTPGATTPFGQHGYARPGTYRVCVTVSDGTGHRSVTGTVRVS